ncbi:tyrosine-type recombinase/integrase [Streptomyces sp. NPDC059578]|uniref:tyrosine-type recombinase/integrase n=1 Tax=Streptomyces sp. NPDC059578 TaxID=3346874 RepID=UPI0036A92800
MAGIRKRPKKNGTATYQVRWLQGGRDGTWENESFEDEDSATDFRDLVEAHGNKWPYGWIPGRGFVEPDEHPHDVPLLDFAREYVDALTSVDIRTREDYHREIKLHFSLLTHRRTDGVDIPATICNLTQRDVSAWVRTEQEGRPNPDSKGRGKKEWLRVPADPKSIRNRHGLLFCIVQSAVDSVPQLRTTNCCKGTKLPRLDHDTDEGMAFLERDEYARVAMEIKDPDARDLADWLVGTGMRWGEATALKVKDLSLASEIPSANIQRAWKKAQRGSPEAYYLGPPKTRKARRLVALSPAQVDTLRRLTAGLEPDSFVFRAAMGGPWRHANFYNRKWLPAVREAMDKGLPKRPRIHDLRHTHVAWLIAAKIPLPAIQVRLGHESIQTTVDRYGHLVRRLDAEIVAAVEAAIAVPAPRADLRVVTG